MSSTNNTAASAKWREKFNSEIANGLMAAPTTAGGGLPAFLGIRFTECSPGRMQAEMEVKPELLTPIGNMHGGVLAAVCDHMLGCVCYPHMKPGQWAATTEFKVNYLAPVSKGTALAEAEIVSLTRTTAVVRISIENEGRTVCLAQGTVLIRDSN